MTVVWGGLEEHEAAVLLGQRGKELFGDFLDELVVLDADAFGFLVFLFQEVADLCEGGEAFPATFDGTATGGAMTFAELSEGRFHCLRS